MTPTLCDLVWTLRKAGVVGGIFFVSKKKVAPVLGLATHGKIEIIPHPPKQTTTTTTTT